MAWPPEPRVVAVTAAKGGVGRTTVALALADALSRDGRRRVACIDASPLTGTLMAIAGAAGAASLDDVADGADKLGTGAALANLAIRRESGVDLFGFPPAAEPSTLGPAEYATVLDLCALHYEVVVVDIGGAPFSRLGAVCVGRAHHAVLVTTPDALTTALTARTLGDLDPARTTVVVNRCLPADGGVRDATARQERARMSADVAGAAATGVAIATAAPATTGEEAATAEADLRAVVAGTPLALPFDVQLAEPPWTAAALHADTRTAVKRVAWTVAEGLR